MSHIQEIAGLPVMFQGAYVVSFGASMGWNTSPSTLNIVVVEPLTETTPGPAAFTGTPISNLQVGRFFSFQVGTFSFGGLLKKREYVESTSDGKKWNLSFLDPRELFKNTIVLTAPTDATLKPLVGPRIIDVYNESSSADCFSNDSGWNTTGMPWGTILTVLNKPGVGVLPGPYDLIKLDVADLATVVDPALRVTGNFHNLLDLIQQAANAAAVDWYVDGTAAANAHAVIRVVNRGTEFENLGVQAFATSYGYGTADNRVKSINVGREWRNEEGCKVLQSANLEFLYDRELKGQTDDERIEYFPELDLTDEGFGVTTPTEAMMRAALVNQNSWEIYLQSINY